MSCPPNTNDSIKNDAYKGSQQKDANKGEVDNLPQTSDVDKTNAKEHTPAYGSTIQPYFASSDDKQSNVHDETQQKKHAALNEQNSSESEKVRNSDSISESDNLEKDSPSALEEPLKRLPTPQESEENLEAENEDTNSEDDEEDYDDNDDDEEEEDDRPMTLKEHLLELRKRVSYAFLCAFFGFLLCYPFARFLFEQIMAPLKHAMPPDTTFIFTAPHEGFFNELKVSFFCGIFLSSPVIFYQIWAFIAPGLYDNEKKVIIPIALASALLFLSGTAFCYLVAFPYAFEFFMTYSNDFMKAMPNISESLSFVMQLLLAFGIVFELPLFVFFLSRMGLVTATWMRSMRRYAVLVIFIVAAILTPPDIMSQMLMAAPMLLLYEISIFVAQFFGKKKEKNDESSEQNENSEEDSDDEEKNTVLSLKK